MVTRNRRLLACGAAVLALAARVATPLAGSSVERLATDPANHPSGLRPSWMACYRLGARIRPVAFLGGEYKIGEAHLTARTEHGGGQGYALLIGSDPAFSPRGINQWGFVSELETQGSVRVFGVMTATDKRSIEELRTATQKPSRGRQMFKVFHATIGGDHATSSVQGLALSDRFTFRDLDAVIAQLPPVRGATEAPLREGTEPGFLFAMGSLMRDNVDAVRRTGRPASDGRRPFVFANGLYSVVTRSSRVVGRMTIEGREFHDVIDTEFEVRTAPNRRGESFRVIYGTDGALREVPVYIEYRPHWWFELAMVLVDPVR
jgi:hypothetical protein